MIPISRGIPAISRLLVVTLCFLQAAPAFSAPRGVGLFDREKQNQNGLAEYIYGDEVEQRLSPVYLLGAVSHPGLYHVPPKTSLTTLLTIAGGPTAESRLDEIVIRNEESKRLEKIDYEDVLKSADRVSPVLQPKDVVLVTPREPAISTNTVTFLSVTALVLTTVMTGLLIKEKL